MTLSASNLAQEFAAHFMFLSTDLHKDFEVVFQGAVQDPVNWYYMIECASQKALYLNLRPKTYLCLPPLGAYSLADGY